MKSFEEHNITTWQIPHMKPEESVAFYLCKTDMGSNVELIPIAKIFAITKYLNDSGIFDVIIPKPGDSNTPPEGENPSVEENIPIETGPNNLELEMLDDEQSELEMLDDEDPAPLA